MARKDLYELCEMCGGNGAIPADTPITVNPPGAAARLLKPTEDGKSFVCPSCRGQRFIATGLSVGQVEKIIRERDELAERVVAMEGRRQ